MGSCFSRGKGSHPHPNPAHKHKQEIGLETTTTTRMGAAAVQQLASNGNTEPVAGGERPMRHQQQTTTFNNCATVLNTNAVNATSHANATATATVQHHPHHHHQQQQQHHSHHRTTQGSEQKQQQQVVVETKVSALFEGYSEPGENAILADGVERLCSDLGLSPDEFRVLLLAWQMNAQQMCRFTRDEFVGGCRAMRVDSLRAIQAKLLQLADDVTRDPDVFKDLYRFTFRFGLDPAQGQRILPAEMAVVLWRLVFTPCEPPILGRWLRFLESHPHVRGVPRDTWNMFLNFAEAVGSDLSTYNDAEAWPSIFDDFVEFENDQANQNITTTTKDANAKSDEAADSVNVSVIQH